MEDHGAKYVSDGATLKLPEEILVQKLDAAAAAPATHQCCCVSEWMAAVVPVDTTAAEGTAGCLYSTNAVCAV